MIVFLSGKSIVLRERVESYFNQIINIHLDSGNESSLSTSYYNFGGYYRGINVFDKALHYYNKAYKTGNSYLEKGYFYRELAGILFELSFFVVSARTYQKASLLEPENIFVLATLGDAELYCGNYEKALNYFDEFLLNNVNNIHDKFEFSLKFTMCNTLVNSFEIKDQKRNKKKAFELLGSLNEKELMKIDKLNKIINIDSLNPMVWSYYSVLSLKDGDLNMHFFPSLMQAVLAKNDSKIWAYLSILTTYEDAYSSLLNDIVNTAYFYNREDYISELQEMIELDGFADFKGEKFTDYVEGLIKTPKEYPMQVRFWDEDEINIIDL